MEKKTVKSNRVVDGELKAASRDIRTVLRWSASLREFREIKTCAAICGDDRHVSYCLTLDSGDGELEIRAKTIAKCFQHAAQLIRAGELKELCGGDEIVKEGEDF